MFSTSCSHSQNMQTSHWMAISEVIIWGFLNEGEANLAASRGAYQQLATFVKLKDPSRLVSWASRPLLGVY